MISLLSFTPAEMSIPPGTGHWWCHTLASCPPESAAHWGSHWTLWCWWLVLVQQLPCPVPVSGASCTPHMCPHCAAHLTTSPRFPHCTSSGGDAGHGPATAPGLQSVFMDQTNYQAKYLGHTMQIKPGQDTRHHEPWSHVSLTLPPGVMMPCRNWAGSWQLACPRCLLSRK